MIFDRGFTSAEIRESQEDRIRRVKKEIYEKAGKRSKEEMIRLASEVRVTLEEEKRRGGGKIKDSIPDILDGQNGEEIFFDDNIIYLPKKGEAIIVGDVHGDPESIISILEQNRFIEEMEKGSNLKIIFLGDYIDRGKKSKQAIELVLDLKKRYPNNIFLLRGNHEERGMMVFGEKSGDTFAKEMMDTFDEDEKKEMDFLGGKTNGGEVFLEYHNLFKIFPSVLVAGNGLIAVHGGAPCDSGISLRKMNSDKVALKETRWVDPSTKFLGIGDNPRRGMGGKVFGKDHFLRFMERIGATVMARSHDIVMKKGNNIVSKFFKNKLVTIFSNGGQKSTNSGYKGQAISPSFARISLEVVKEGWEDPDFQAITYKELNL
ncbi:hypothetical protein A2316_01040 [Candidatus Falkowbacteria bacterium RIFOXYB2_FULL_38_15]|uniref:Serine/threonine specific protein phosphatases domain-containing protein n=1 Tax=Candidatus Falkowbacteria bacterium RIFOXYA2_FULL_38_12 TaxID=1797993 RepID=A0A1F5S4L6_9BACT|nr:MAG: hypothetical protein A2257_02445 [Candidatus Falkowbacteria bacterium RIFOXYA2_FULL_38_12]OGF32775.1 MAG: hypothetical protein A2316_01040 [Candidatus Falkowbacteria bacterium RIFOXYB2_FULL_38_15]OGF42189.1 MAG: hypothetical protein A2555_02855 [Candidatus Falkowbacteria bacterium RIFOXYD2_FULL_39_16]